MMSLFSVPHAYAVPQLYGPDLLVRLRPSQLKDILFEHLCTMQEHAVLLDARTLMGMKAIDGGVTEWQGQYGHRVVSLAWDWVMTADGAISALETVSPRSNLCLLDNKGYDMPETEGGICLVDHLRQIPWHAHVGKAVRQIRRPH